MEDYAPVAKKYHLRKEQLITTCKSKGYCVAVNGRIATSVLEPSHLYEPSLCTM